MEEAKQTNLELHLKLQINFVITVRKTDLIKRRD